MNARASVTPALSALGLAARSYGMRGWAVFRCKPGTKEPLGGHGHLDATSDPRQIEEWWTATPDANIGLSLAASGLVCVDVDTYKPECGWASFVAGRDLPDTLVQRSARGGTHLFFKAAPGASYPKELCAGVDIKHNGYVLLEPSRFAGGTYQWQTDDDPAPVPDWVPVKAAPKIEARTTCQIDTGGTVAGLAEVQDLLSWIDADLAYPDWVKVLQAVHAHTGGSAEGLALAESWSAQGSKYRPGEVPRKWAGFKVGGGVGIGTIAKLAGDAGADLSAIARRHRGSGNHAHDAHTSDGAERPNDDAEPDLSHDALALEMGECGWDRDARHVALWGAWLFWTGHHWQRDESLEHLTRARVFLRGKAAALIRWAEKKAQKIDPKDRERLIAWAKAEGRTLRGKTTVAAVENLARGNPACVARAQDFDADTMLLGTPGGTVDLRTGILRPARRGDMITKLTACAPAPGKAARWQQFLHEVFAGDTELIAFMQRVAGYALTGETREQKLLFLYGTGRNGKSVFLDVLTHVWKDYGRRAPAAAFLHGQGERHPTDIASLQGARLVVGSELPRGKTWDESVIKDLTGGDRMTARFMRQDYFEFDPQLTLMIAGNTMPSFRGVDEAIRARVVLVPFTVTFPPEKRDPHLADKLKAEAPHILQWAIEGALQWQDTGLAVPASVAAASADYFDGEDIIAQFLADEVEQVVGAFTSAKDLHQRFKQWALDQGLGEWSQNTLIKELRGRGFTDHRTGSGGRGLRGLRLKGRAR